MVLGPSNPVGRFLVQRDASGTLSTLSVQLAYQSNFFNVAFTRGDQHSMKIKAALHLFYLWSLIRNMKETDFGSRLIDSSSQFRHPESRNTAAL